MYLVYVIQRLYNLIGAPYLTGMATMQIWPLIVFSLSGRLSGASIVPLLSTSALMNGTSYIPHFVLFYKGQKIQDDDPNGRSVDFDKRSIVVFFGPKLYQ